MKKRLALLMLVSLLVFSTAACNKKVKADDSENKPPEQQEKVVDKGQDKEEELIYVLYLRHKDLPFIFSDAYTIGSKDPRLEGKSLELFVLEELIKQQRTEDLINPIPANTKVISVSKQGSKLTVDLSKEFQLNMTGTQEDVNIAVAVLVNTLTALPDIETVTILVEGSQVTNLRGVDISGEFEFTMEYHADK